MNKNRRHIDTTQTSKQLFRESLSAWNASSLARPIRSWFKRFTDSKTNVRRKNTNTQHKLVARARRHIVCIRFRHILHGRGLRALFLVSHWKLGFDLVYFFLRLTIFQIHCFIAFECELLCCLSWATKLVSCLKLKFLITVFFPDNSLGFRLIASSAHRQCSFSV